MPALTEVKECSLISVAERSKILRQWWVFLIEAFILVILNIFKSLIKYNLLFLYNHFPSVFYCLFGFEVQEELVQKHPFRAELP